MEEKVCVFTSVRGKSVTLANPQRLSGLIQRSYGGQVLGEPHCVMVSVFVGILRMC